MRCHQILLPALAVCVGACATVGRLALVEPTVTLREVRIAGLGLRGGTLTLVVDVDNPNPFGLRGVALTTELALDDTPFGGAQWDRDIEIPRREVVAVEIPLQFTWSGVGAGARSLLRTGSIPYRMNGQISADTPVGPFTTDFANAGSVTLLDLVRRHP